MDLTSTIVGIKQCHDYDQMVLAAALQDLNRKCCPVVNLQSARVVIKPNLISASHGPLACTEGRFILAAVTFFKEMGAQVVVGDSPAFGTARGVLDKIGILSFLKRMEVPVADFTRVESAVLPSGLQVGLASDALGCDLLVNLPRVKAHEQLRVTMAVKNYFGCVVGMRKPCWHMKYGGKSGPFNKYIVELLRVLPPSVSFVDGVIAMHRSGPIHGEPYRLGIVACSANPVAADRALLDILGLSSSVSPLLQACRDAGIMGTRLADIEFPFLAPGAVRREDFKVPDELSPIRFNPVRFIRNNIKRIILQQRATR